MWTLEDVRPGSAEPLEGGLVLDIPQTEGYSLGTMKSGRWKFVLAVAVIAGGIAVLMAGKLRDAFRYSEGVAAVAQAGEGLLGRPLRIQGTMVNDSLVKKREAGKPYFEFAVSEGYATLTVRYDEILPDTLVNGAVVTAEGTLERPGYFRATKILAKCPSKYDSARVPAGYRPPDPYRAAGRSAPEAALTPQTQATPPAASPGRAQAAPASSR
jgi:cytochrome c-type biogenesis protein CcmE